MTKPYYQDEAVTIYHGDCREIVSTLGRFDLLLTDPPYGVALNSRGQLFVRDDIKINMDQDTGMAEWIKAICSATKTPVAMFFSPYRPCGYPWRNVLVWDKGGAVGGGGDQATCWKRTVELIGVSYNRPLNGLRDAAVLRYPVTPACFRLHPCQKPRELLAYLLAKLTNPGDTILDPFAGSGTTGRAAKDLGRKAVLIELEEKYCEIAAKRMAQAVLPFAREPSKATEPAQLFTEAQQP
jgi:site-specific DNA-methyltransferase (adenine-specific)